MASGSFNLSLEHPSSSVSFQGKIDWTSTSNGAVANSSLVECKIYARKQGSSTPTSGTFKGSITIDGTKTTFSQSKSVSNSWVLISTSSKTVSHNTNGTKTITIAGEVGKVSGTTLANINSIGSSSATLDTIARKITITDSAVFNDEYTFGNNLSAPAYPNYTSAKICLSLDGTNPLDTWKDITLTNNHPFYVYTITENEQNAMYLAHPNDSTFNVYVMVRSVLGGSTYTDKIQKTISIINANPEYDASALSVIDTNASVVAVTSDNTKLVGLESIPELIWTAPTIKKGASLSYMSFVFIGGVREPSYTTDTLTGSYTFTEKPSGTFTIRCIVEDSRGNRTSFDKTINVIEYNYPQIGGSLKRVNNYENETKLTINASISSVDSLNSIQLLQYRYKKDATGENWSAWTNISNGVETTLTLDNNFGWFFEFKCEDKFDYDTVSGYLNKGLFVLFIDVVKNSVGINCFPEKNNSLEVNGVEIATEEEEIWSGSTILDYNDTITLDISISKTQRGFAFLWEHQNGEQQVTYAPKTLSYSELNYFLISAGGIGYKRVILSGHDTLTGDAVNGGSGTIGGITYDSSKWYLKKVYRV